MTQLQCFLHFDCCFSSPARQVFIAESGGLLFFAHQFSYLLTTARVILPVMDFIYFTIFLSYIYF